MGRRWVVDADRVAADDDDADVHADAVAAGDVDAGDVAGDAVANDDVDDNDDGEHDDVKVDEQSNQYYVIKRNNDFMAISTPQFKFLDVMNYITPGFSYSKYLKAYNQLPLTFSR